MLIQRPNSAVLCLQCTNLIPLLVDISKSRKDGNAHKKWWDETYGKIRSIHGIAPDDCELCRILHKAFGKLPGFNSTDAKINISHRRLATYKDLQHSSCSFEACGARLALAPVLPVVQTDDGKDIEAFTGRFVLPVLNPLLVRDWLNRCERHISCGPNHTLKDFNFPFRLIDVQKGCLVEAPVDCHYVALSYVWGSVKQVMLNKVTQKLLEQEGSIGAEGLKDLKGGYISLKPHLAGRVVPRTIRDAILLCRLLKERYLWTDSLCILQDNEFQDSSGAWTNADKLAQIPKMDIIYSASLFTIIAASGADSNAGLPGVQLSNTRMTQIVGGIGDQIFVSITEDPLTSLWSSKWSERAWTFQEFLLSKRHLIFLPEQVVFHCSTLSWSEDLSLEFVENPDSQSVPSWTRSSKLRPLQLPDRSRWSQEIFFPAIFINQYYSEWLKNLLRRQLTVQSDILFAFDGALSASAPYLGKFHYGLPVDYFCESLHWTVGRESMYMEHSFKHDKGLTKRRQGFPSWSWTGWIWDVASFQEFHTNYQVKSPEYWCRVGVYGTKVMEDGLVQLWKISSPDIKGWNRLECFPTTTFQMDNDFINGELRYKCEIIKKSLIPTNCLVIKTAATKIFIGDQQHNKWTSEFSIFSSSELTPENRIGGLHLPSEWQQEMDKSLQVIITGSYFYGPDPRSPDKTDEMDPMIDCLVVKQIHNSEMERLTAFTMRFSHARTLEWKPIVTVLR